MGEDLPTSTKWRLTQMISKLKRASTVMVCLMALLFTTGYQSYPLSTCAMEEWTTGVQNHCGLPAQDCPGYCRQIWYDHAKCNFNPLDTCNVDVGIQAYGTYSDSNCTLSGVGCACQGGVEIGGGTITVTTDWCHN